jgi:hypothetical protein
VINKVAGIVPAGIGKCKTVPVFLAANVLLHSVHNFVDRNVTAVDSRGRTENTIDLIAEGEKTVIVGFQVGVTVGAAELATRDASA